MKKIALVYTGMGTLVNDIERIFHEALGPDMILDHIIDSRLIWDLAEQGQTPQISRRLTALYDAAAASGPDLIIGTCSSIGAFTEEYAEKHPDQKLLRIDYPMAAYAAAHGSRIAVVATLETTVQPSVELVSRLAAAGGRAPEVLGITVPGAIEALMAGRKEEAAELVANCVRENCAGADIVILAQASMALFRDAILGVLDENTCLLESPTTCAEYIKTIR